MSIAREVGTAEGEVNVPFASDSDLERSFKALEMYGVPRERAKSVSNGIMVLVTRMDKEVAQLMKERDDARELYQSALAGMQELERVNGKLQVEKSEARIEGYEAGRESMRVHLVFVERWAVHHARTQPAANCLNVLASYPIIKAITESYGKESR